MTLRHTILIVEDDPKNAQSLAEMVQSMDMDCKVAGTLEEVRALLGGGLCPCGVLQDMQLPHAEGARPHEKTGESSIALVKGIWNGKGRPAIVVVTAFRADPDYVWQMAELEVDGFVAKTNVQVLPEKLRAAMKKHGREEHANCAACSKAARVVPVRSAADGAAGAGREDAAAPKVTLAIEGESIRGRTSIRACGERILLQDSKFVILLRAVVAHERSAGSWSDRYDLGIGDDRGMVTHLRNELKEVVPEGFQVLEAGGGKQYRLNPEIVVEGTKWEKLVEHPSAVVRKIAVEMVKRKGRGD
jgi:CheY-like chemotaxis protein